MADGLQERLPNTLHGARIYRPIQTVGIANDVPDIADELLISNGYRVEREGLHGKISPEELTALLRDRMVDALITRTSLPVTADVLTGSRLQLVMGACKRPKVDVMAARNLGIEVFGTHANTEQVVQLVMGALYSFSSGNVAGADTTRRNEWQKKEIGGTNFTLRGRKLGIMGFGRIGRMLAERAKANGLEVYVFNDYSELPRHYEDHLREVADRIGVQQVGSKEELLDRVDILTVHTGLEDHLGMANKRIITPDDLRKMGRNGGLGMFINFDRYDIGPSHEEIHGLLDEDALKYYATDVFPSEHEKPGAFAYPFKPDDQRVITTPHIGGSNPAVLMQAAKEAAMRLDRWVGSGDIRGDSITYPRLDVPVSPYDGQVVFAIARSTRQGIFANVLEVFASNNLSVRDIRMTGDYVPGTRKDRETAYQVVLSDPANHRSYEEIVRYVTLGLARLNSDGSKSVISIRPIPTNVEQREGLKAVL